MYMYSIYLRSRYSVCTYFEAVFKMFGYIIKGSNSTIFLMILFSMKDHPQRKVFWSSQSLPFKMFIYDVWIHTHLFLPCFQRETIFMTSCLLTSVGLPGGRSVPKMGSTLQGKNLLQKSKFFP